MGGRADAPYIWLMIAAEREVAAWAAQRGYLERLSPLVAGDRRAAEFQAVLGAVTAAAFSVEALYLEVLQRLRSDPERDEKWEVPEVASKRSKKKRVSRYQQVLLTLRYDDVLDDDRSWREDLQWLFSNRNAVVHFDTHDEQVTVDLAAECMTVPTVLDHRAEEASRAVEIALRVLNAQGTVDLSAIRDHRPHQGWFERTYPHR